jgi:hypothetical protein
VRPAKVGRQWRLGRVLLRTSGRIKMVRPFSFH